MVFEKMLKNVEKSSQCIWPRSLGQT